MRQSLNTILFLLTFGLGAAPAGPSTTGLAWNWEGQSRTWHIVSQVKLPEFVWWRALNNDEARVQEVRIDSVLTCRPIGPIGKKGWEVWCRIDDIALSGATLPSDRGRLDPIVKEWDTRITGAELEMDWSRDGKISNIGWVGLERRNQRDGENIEVMRQLMSRNLASLDFGLPKHGDDKGAGQWVQKNPLLVHLPSSQGVVGGMSVTHTITAAKETKVKFATSGKGTIASTGSTTTMSGGSDDPGQEAINNFYAMELNSEGLWDSALGHIVRRESVATGTPTSSSVQAEGYAGLPYVQGHRVELITSGTAPPVLGESGEVPSVF
jgi:hypothetical protein